MAALHLGRCTRRLGVSHLPRSPGYLHLQQGWQDRLEEGAPGNVFVEPAAAAAVQRPCAGKSRRNGWLLRLGPSRSRLVAGWKRLGRGISQLFLFEDEFTLSRQTSGGRCVARIRRPQGIVDAQSPHRCSLRQDVRRLAAYLPSLLHRFQSPAVPHDRHLERLRRGHRHRARHPALLECLRITLESMDDVEFRRRADQAIESLKRSLLRAEESADIEVEENAGALKISFEEPPGTFVVSPNAPVKQIWISALSTSFKLDWSDTVGDFVLPKTGENIKALLSRLINQQLGQEAVTLT